MTKQEIVEKALLTDMEICCATLSIDDDGYLPIQQATAKAQLDKILALKFGSYTLADLIVMAERAKEGNGAILQKT